MKKIQLNLAPKKEHPIPACSGVAFKVQAGEFVQLTDPNGQQPGDFWAFNADDVDEFLSAEHTRIFVGRLCPTVGQSFVTNHRRPILQLVDDTCGVHDMLTAACDPHRYVMYGVRGSHPSCAENLVGSMKRLGHESVRVPQPVNFFTRVDIKPDGTIETFEPPSKPDDQVILKAWINCVVAISACPQEFNPVAGYFPTDLLARVLVPDVTP